ncbi:hypothetical protein P280DRAFT_472127 [Massarina eburnea CBS 473.64]|uniref:1-alkyl-2-acetylglycerophosphocholine esterase n=1 Tax=Massarina eburnea CBS 473.64 TaxID=1395130 RepID=A0A6A6RQD9_9PLEO|nr:hypothetical protein P280DRAFT_472127 [Massarina eburnea CBS 473.64]
MRLPILTLLSPILAGASTTQFPPPTGPYNVGYIQHIFNHTTPNDPVAPANASSILLATIYYPTLSIPTPNATASYLDPTTAKVWGSALKFPSGTLESLRSWNQPNAAFLTEGTGLPTVIFSPGGGANGIMYTALNSELASQGYTVVALDHPGEIPYLALPYGSPSGVYGLDITAVWNKTLQTAVYNMRISDALAVIQDLYTPYVDEIKAPWNTTHFFMAGHSIGGAAAAGSMEKEPKILGGVNLDGGFYDPLPVATRPFLLMAGNEHTPSLDPTWSPFSAIQTGWWEWVNVTGTEHLDYSDLGDWVDLLGLRNQTLLTPKLGPIWGPRMDHIVAHWVLGLFDFVLCRKGDEGGMEVPSHEFPEVVRWNGSSKAI